VGNVTQVRFLAGVARPARVVRPWRYPVQHRYSTACSTAALLAILTHATMRIPDA